VWSNRVWKQNSCSSSWKDCLPHTWIVVLFPLSLLDWRKDGPFRSSGPFRGTACTHTYHFLDSPNGPKTQCDVSIPLSENTYAHTHTHTLSLQTPPIRSSGVANRVQKQKQWKSEIHIDVIVILYRKYSTGRLSPCHPGSVAKAALLFSTLLHRRVHRELGRGKLREADSSSSAY